MSQQAEDLLRVIVERAVEMENIPVPAIWRSRIVDLCVRVVHKLITADRAVVALVGEWHRQQGAEPSTSTKREG